jgi:hypothetical protein
MFMPPPLIHAHILMDPMTINEYNSALFKHNFVRGLLWI